MPAMERRALGQLMAEDGRLDQRHARRLWKRRDGSATPQRFVDDLPGNVRRLLEHCGLEFEPACLEFHKTERSVRTASSEQVRQPLYREGLEQWRRYEPWLTPLREALGDALTRYRAEKL